MRNNLRSFSLPDLKKVKSMQEKHQKKLFWAILISEASHIFCCVLPTIFSVISVLVGLGIVATMPGWLAGFHDLMHGWEMPMIMLSAGVVALGWGVHFYSLKYDCHDVGDCHHGPCGPKKRRASKILIAATVLLLVNVSVYFGVHRVQDSLSHVSEGAHHNHDH